MGVLHPAAEASKLPTVRLSTRAAGNESHHGVIFSPEETTMTNQNTGDEDAGKGAVEQDRPQQETNTSMSGQIGHRDQDPMLKSSNSDFPESGQNEEHTGEPHTRDELNRDTEVNPE